MHAGPNQAPVSPVSDNDFRYRRFYHPRFEPFSVVNRLCWGNYRPKISGSSNPGLALGLTVSYSGGIAPGTARYQAHGNQAELKSRFGRIEKVRERTTYMNKLLFIMTFSTLLLVFRGHFSHLVLTALNPGY